MNMGFAVGSEIVAVTAVATVTRWRKPCSNQSAKSSPHAMSSIPTHSPTASACSGARDAAHVFQKPSLEPVPHSVAKPSTMKIAAAIE